MHFYQILSLQNSRSAASNVNIKITEEHASKSLKYCFINCDQSQKIVTNDQQ